MLLELVLVAAVSTLAGLAVYQANHRAKTAEQAAVVSPAPSATETLANKAAAVSLQDSANDASVSATAEASVDEVSATDTDVSNLGSSSDAF